jgi:hypothetical protein
MSIISRPDYALRLTRVVLQVQIYYFLIKATVRFTYNVWALTSYVSSFLI